MNNGLVKLTITFALSNRRSIVEQKMLSLRGRKMLFQEDFMFLVVLEDQVVSTFQNQIRAVNLLQKKDHLLRILKWQS